MTSKPGVKRAGSSPTTPTVSTTSAHRFSPLRLESEISASRIGLFPGYCIHYAVFNALYPSQGHLDIDVARRKVYEVNAGKPVEDSFLTYSQIGKAESALWVFCIEQDSIRGKETNLSSRFINLELINLTWTAQDGFSYSELYPCSIPCSIQREPCPTCLQLSSTSDPISNLKREPNSQASHLPRHPLRQPLAFFLSAVRDRIINDICENAMTSRKVARRLRTGIIWYPSSSSSNWEDGWEQHGNTRPLTFSHIQVALFPSGLFVQPHLQLTHFLPFLPSLPLPPGTPINLLPFSIPAYYLNIYSGSISALTKQFQTNLVGLGAGDLLPTNQTYQSSQFVIAWVSVQNKQGEEKGTLIIWPAVLCLSLMSMPETSDESDDNVRLFAYNRKSLTHLPELPLALQASPIPAPATVPTQLPRSVSPHESIISPSLFTPIGRTSFSREPSPSIPFSSRYPNYVKDERPPSARATSSFSTDAAQAFQTLAISQLPPSGMRHVAEGVGKFVDFMAKERERERERIRKEKEREASAIASAAAQAAKTLVPPATPDVTAPNANLTTVDPLQASMVHDLAGLTPGVMPTIAVDTHSSSDASQTQAQQHQLAVPPNHPSYPSPPEEVVKVEQTAALPDNGSPDEYASNAVTNINQQPQITPSDSETFESFGGMDKFMMDLDMDFNITIPSSAGHAPESMKVDLDSYGVFTDDDFSFFDDPVSTIGLPDSVQEVLSNDEAIKSFGIPMMMQDGLQSTEPGPAVSHVSFDDASSWNLSRSVDAKGHGTSAPDLLPDSPDGSTSSTLGPATPHIISVDDVEASNSRPFDPVLFSKRFVSVDAKYALGKFSKSIIEKDSINLENSVTVLWRMTYDSLTDPRVVVVKKLVGMKRRLAEQGGRFGHPSPPFLSERGEWESYIPLDDDASVADDDTERDSDGDYDKIDENGGDPVSRPSTPLASHLPLGPTLLSTQFQHSLLLPLSVNLRSPGASFATGLDMASPLPNPVPTPVSPAAVAGAASEKSKSLEIAMRALAFEVVENTLWETAWRVSSLGRAPIWKQSSPCEGVDVSVDEGNLLAVDSARNKVNIEAFMCLVGLDSSSDGVRPERTGSTLKPLGQPMFVVGKADGIVYMAPPALRFWSKIGLTPRSGPKDVVVFFLYEEGSKPLGEVETWAKRVCSIYNAKGYGKQSFGKSSLCVVDGLVPVRYPTFRKTLSSLVDSVGTGETALLMYIVTPNSILSPSSSILRQIFTSINRALTSHEEGIVRFHLIPDYLLSKKDDSAITSQLETVANNVYERIPRPIDRFMSRSFAANEEKTRKYSQAPAFTLARSSLPSTSYTFQHPSHNDSLLFRHTLLHVGYRLTKSKKWLVAACIDQRGEGHDLGVWLASDEGDHKQHVSQIWNFAKEFTKRANVEWRVAIAKLETMDEVELGAWNILLSDELAGGKQTYHVSILCVDDESGWSVLPEDLSSPRAAQRPPSSHDSQVKTQSQNHSQSQSQHQPGGQGQLFSSTQATYVLPSLRYPLPPPSRTSIDVELGAAQYIPEDDESRHLTSADLGLRPLLSSALLTIPSPSLSAGAAPKAQFIHLLQAETSPVPSSLPSKTETETETETETAEQILHGICQNYHELTVLTQARWPSMSGNGREMASSSVPSPLPYHLAALHVVNSALELTKLDTE